jgi:hypothetical protein
MTADTYVGLAVTSRERASIAPDVPTIYEAGFPTLAVETTAGRVVLSISAPAEGHVAPGRAEVAQLGAGGAVVIAMHNAVEHVRPNQWRQPADDLAGHDRPAADDGVQIHAAGIALLGDFVIGRLE